MHQTKLGAANVSTQIDWFWFMTILEQAHSRASSIRSQKSVSAASVQRQSA